MFKISTAASALFLSTLALLSFSNARGAESPAKPEGPRYRLNGVPIELTTLAGTRPLNGLQEVCDQVTEPDWVASDQSGVKSLGAALVYFGPANGESIFGHLGERFVYCKQDKAGRYRLFDFLYEYIEFIPEFLVDDHLIEDYGLAPDASTLSYLKGSIYLKVSSDVPQRYHAEQLVTNRSIEEIWFDLPGDDHLPEPAVHHDIHRMLLENRNNLKAQRASLLARKKLPKYEFPINTCVTPLEKSLKVVNPKYLPRPLWTPALIKRWAEKQPVKHLLIYPSQTELAVISKKKENILAGLPGLNSAPQNAPQSDELFTAGDPNKPLIFQDDLHRVKLPPGPPEKSWMLVYPGGNNLAEHLLISPAAGVANLAEALGETVFGAIMLPWDLKHRKKVVAAESLDGVSERVVGEESVTLKQMPRILHGAYDLLASSFEIFGLRVRYPHATPMTPEEKELFTDYAQAAVLEEFLKVDFHKADGTPSDVAVVAHDPVD